MSTRVTIRQDTTPCNTMGSEDVALLLLRHGADPGVRDDDGQTLLHAGLTRGKAQVRSAASRSSVSMSTRVTMRAGHHSM